MSHAFEPDWCSPPGDTIADILTQRRLSTGEFAVRIGLTSTEALDLIAGRFIITAELASRLSVVLGSTTTFWGNREAQYRADLARLASRQPAISDDQWLRELPLADMIRFGWIPKVSTTTEKIAACCRFFGVDSPSTWRTRQQVVTAYRTSLAFKSQPGSVSAWLRQGEIASESIVCQPWNIDRFKEMLPALRALTRRRESADFISELQASCAKCGVAVIVVRAPKGCPASGATRFITPEKALLQLSFRYLSDDQFWFSFFHEAGHLVLHNKALLFLEGSDHSKTIEESEANDFAACILVPPEFRNEMLSLPLQVKPIIRFAQRIGISPGIVAGQLQHFGRLKHYQLPGLKRRFEWG